MAPSVRICRKDSLKHFKQVVTLEPRNITVGPSSIQAREITVIDLLPHGSGIH